MRLEQLAHILCFTSSIRSISVAHTASETEQKTNGTSFESRKPSTLATRSKANEGEGSDLNHRNRFTG